MAGVGARLDFSQLLMTCQSISHRSPINFLQLQPMPLPAPSQCYMILSFLILFTPRIILPLSICFLLNSSVSCGFFFFFGSYKNKSTKILVYSHVLPVGGPLQKPQKEVSPKHME